MTPSRLLVRTPSRLHFGLLGWAPGASRQFGGLGLMIAAPAIEMIVERSSTPRFEGPLAGRARKIAEDLAARLAGREVPPGPISVRILAAPPEHVGLGVGTQLSMAIAAAVVQLAGGPPSSAEELARLTGRGRRSGIGLHGFRHGGFIVDGGRMAAGVPPPMIARYAFPGEWSVAVVQPPGVHGLHGPEETRAFAELPPIGERVTERLCRIALLGILPAIVERNLAGFGAALEEFQAHVGSGFAPAQGGPYSSPRASEIIRELHAAGFAGCGQSSWGPTIYGFSERPESEVLRSADQLRRRLGLEPAALLVTRASNQGATIDPV